MKKMCKLGIVLLVLTVFLLAMSLETFATAVNVCDNQISISDTADTGTSDGTTYTATAKGGMFSKKTNTITITNAGSSKATIKFDYTAEKANAFTIDGASGETSGSVEKELEIGGTIAIVLTSNSGISNTTATLTLTNFKYTAVVDSSNVSFEFDSALGSVTIDGTEIASGASATIEAAAPPVIKVTPVTGQTFVGWVNSADNTSISTSAEFSLKPTGDMTIRALFSDGTAPYFLVDDTYIYDNFSHALEAGDNLVLMCDAVLEAGEYTIPTDKSLLIPFDAANTIYDKNKFPTGIQGYTNPTPYRTLTMKSGAEFIVNGALNVSANQSSRQGTTGAPTGKYGHINMQEGSAITIHTNGTLYAWGYISGSGTVLAKSGAMVYENFQVMDYRGGTAVASSMYNNSQRVFPMSQYYVQNIEVPLILEAGAVENGYTNVFVSGKLGAADTINGTPVPFIGPDGMFNITRGSITKDYDENTDRLMIDINDGTLGMKSLSISLDVMGLGVATTINSEKYTLPINGNITLNVRSGSDVTITQDMALLPGCEIYVEENSSIKFASGVKGFIYDRDQWVYEADGVEKGYCYIYNNKFLPVKYACGRQYTRTDADLKDAMVNVAGTVDASDAMVYTTESGANICGVEGALVTLQQGTQTVTYQAIQGGSDGTDITYSEIPITTAKLKNNDDTYTEPAGNTTYCLNYRYTNGVWEVEHTGLTMVAAKAPTCTAAGWEEYEYCANCKYTTYVEIPALGHDKVAHEGQAATCEGIGWDAYATCTRCDYTSYEEIDPLGHAFKDLICTECGLEKKVTKTECSIVDGNLELDISLLLDVEDSDHIIAAAYDDYGRLLRMTLCTVDTLEKITMPAKGVANVKILIWSDLITMKYVSFMESIIIDEIVK